jgi:hypothetical protein
MWELRCSPCSPNTTTPLVIITQNHHRPSIAAVSEPLAVTSVCPPTQFDSRCNTSVTVHPHRQISAAFMEIIHAGRGQFSSYLPTAVHDMQCVQNRVSKQGWTSSLPLACAICFAGIQAFVDNTIPHPLFSTQSCVCSSVDQTAAS